MATFLPTDGVCSGVFMPCSLSQSAAKRSRRPMATGSPVLVSMHFCSHCSSWGHTLPPVSYTHLLVPKLIVSSVGLGGTTTSFPKVVNTFSKGI